MKHLINLSNHPAESWDAAQRAPWDRVTTIPFPNIDPNLTVEEVRDLVIATVDKIDEAITLENDNYIMLQGEFSFCYLMFDYLLNFKNIKLAIPSTKREVVESEGKKTSYFKFVSWRIIEPAEGG